MTSFSCPWNLCTVPILTFESGKISLIFLSNNNGIVAQKNYMYNQNDFFNGDFLIGFNKDQHAVDIRNRFIRNLKHIAGACDELMGGKVSCITECAGLKTATQDYVKTIEEYNERVSKLAGDFLGEVKYELKRPVKVHTLQEAVASFDKNFYLAQIYANMEKSNKMIRDDGKDYL